LEAPTEAEPTSDATGAAEAAPATGASAGADTGADLGHEVRRCIDALQHDLGTRIERILGARGGLLVVLDQVSDADDARAAALSEQIPIALIDHRTLRGLQRLGAASPAADAEQLYAAPAESQPATRVEPPLLRRARQQLEAAEVLLRQGCPAPGAELLLGALLNTAALRCDQDHATEPSRTAVWLYAEALPSGALQPDDAALIMRAQSLSQAGDDVPAELLAALVADVAQFVEGSAPPAQP
jgi:hypothetical protein